LQQLDDQKQKTAQLEKVIYSLRQYEVRVIEYENKIPLLTNEIERLNEVIRSKL
jgi:chromosome segregation ATPase